MHLSDYVIVEFVIVITIRNLINCAALTGSIAQSSQDNFYDSFMVLLQYFWSFKSSATIYCNLAEMSNHHSLQSFSFCAPQKKHIQVWNGTMQGWVNEDFSFLGAFTEAESREGFWRFPLTSLLIRYSLLLCPRIFRELFLPSRRLNLQGKITEGFLKPQILKAVFEHY